MISYYHSNLQTLSILSGPHAVQSDYVRKLTRCGNPEVFTDADLAQFGLVPEVKPALGQYQSYGDPIVSAEAVTFPVVDWTQAEIDAYEAQALIDRRAAMSVTPRQGRRALDAAGLLDAVEAWIATQPRAVQIDYESATEWRRDWPLIEDVRVALEWTHEEMDALFAIALTR
jgi:hypothetical protein